MSNRLDQEREKELQPTRMVYAKNSLIMMGFHVCYEDATRIEFVYKGDCEALCLGIQDKFYQH